MGGKAFIFRLYWMNNIQTQTTFPRYYHRFCVKRLMGYAGYTVGQHNNNIATIVTKAEMITVSIFLTL